jgi:hypothetical protein
MYTLRDQGILCNIMFSFLGTCGREHRQVAVHPPRERRLGFAAVPAGHAYRGQ